MKPGILIYAAGSSEWIGGVYYARNVLYQLSLNKRITDKYNLFAFTNETCKASFEDLDKVKIIVSRGSEKIDLIKAILLHNIRYRYPGTKDIGMCKAVAWIPDFQQECLSDMFPAEEVEARKLERASIVNKDLPLVLSSEDALGHFKQFYDAQKKNVYVVHFVSYIEPIIRSISTEAEEKVLKKYGLSGRKYVYVANQFWKHKNHIVVLNAIQKIAADTNLYFVFSGKLSDYRNPDYIEKLKQIMTELEEGGRIINLGFLDRTEQLIIMKNCEFLIQPSLFEGWGTVVEDAKVLDKHILLSDIPVHREQRNEKCRLFVPDDDEALAKIILEEEEKEHTSDVEQGILTMREQALAYSEAFERLLWEDTNH